MNFWTFPSPKKHFEAYWFWWAAQLAFVWKEREFWPQSPPKVACGVFFFGSKGPWKFDQQNMSSFLGAAAGGGSSFSRQLCGSRGHNWYLATQYVKWVRKWEQWLVGSSSLSSSFHQTIAMMQTIHSWVTSSFHARLLASWKFDFFPFEPQVLHCHMCRGTGVHFNPPVP